MFYDLGAALREKFVSQAFFFFFLAGHMFLFQPEAVLAGILSIPHAGKLFVLFQ